MRLTYDPFTEELMVLSDYQSLVPDMTLKQFYIKARKDAGIKINKLEKDSGLTVGRLRFLEHPKIKGSKTHNSVKAILIALDTLGYNLEFKG